MAAAALALGGDLGVATLPSVRLAMLQCCASQRVPPLPWVEEREPYFIHTSDRSDKLKYSKVSAKVLCSRTADMKGITCCVMS